MQLGTHRDGNIWALRCSGVLNVKSKRNGLTLVEVVIAMALITMLCGGLYAVGLRAERITHHNRLASEASALAKQRMEEMIAIGRSGLSQPSCTLVNADTNASSRDEVIERHPRLAWHAPNGVLSGTSTSAYAEVHVDVMFVSPLNERRVTNTYSMIVE